MSQTDLPQRTHRESPFLKGSEGSIELENDFLNRGTFASNIADLIVQDATAEKSNNEPDYTSTVIGLEGDWGAGKSYILGKIKEELPVNYLWLEFTPWEFQDSRELSKVFLEWLSSETNRCAPDQSVKWLKNSLLGTRLTDTAQTITLWLIYVVPILLIIAAWAYDNKGLQTVGLAALFIDLIAHIVCRGLKDFSYYLRKYSENLDNPSKQKKYKKLVQKKLLKEFSDYTRIIICIEDIDRLTPGQLRECLKTIKLVSDFKKVTYLIPYDPTYTVLSLNKMLDDQDNDFGAGYIQKIFHTSIHIPPVDGEEILPEFQKWAEAKWKHHYQGSKLQQESFEHDYYQLVLDKVISTLPNLRKVHRVFNKATVILNSLKEFSNPGDAILMAYISEFHTQLWKLLDKESTDRWIRPSYFFGENLDSTFKSMVADKEILYKRAVGEENLHVLEILRTLSIQAQKLENYPSYSIWRDSVNFRLYTRFHQKDINKTDKFFSDYLELNSLDKKKDFIAKIFSTPEAQERVFFERLIQEYKNKLFIWSSEISPIIEYVATLEENLRSDYASKIFWELIKFHKDPISALKSFFQQLIDSNQFRLVFLILSNILHKEGWAKDRVQGYEQYYYSFKFSEADYLVLEEKALAKLEQFINTNRLNKLFEQREIATTFVALRRISEEKFMQLIVDKAKEDDYTFFMLLNSFMSTRTNSKGSVNYISDSFAKMIGFKDIKELKDEIYYKSAQSSHPSRLYKEVQDAVDAGVEIAKMDSNSTPI